MRAVSLCMQNGGRVEALRKDDRRGSIRFRAACWEAVRLGWLRHSRDQSNGRRLVFVPGDKLHDLMTAPTHPVRS